jgi:hypothetical protein
MFVRLMVEKSQPIVLNLNHVRSIVPVGPRAMIKLIDRDVLTVEHSCDEVCDRMVRVARRRPNRSGGPRPEG